MHSLIAGEMVEEMMGVCHMIIVMMVVAMVIMTVRVVVIVGAGEVSHRPHRHHHLETSMGFPVAHCIKIKL